MKKVAAISAIALAMGMGSALAADLPSRKEAIYVPPPPPPLTWNGFYAGVNVGGGWNANNSHNNIVPYWDPTFPFGAAMAGATNLFFLPTSYSYQNGTAGGVVGGAQVGYNFQFNPSIVVGVETDFQGSSIGNNNLSQATPFYASPISAGLLIPLVTTGGGHDRHQLDRHGARPRRLARSCPRCSSTARRASPMPASTPGTTTTPAPAGPPAAAWNT